MSSHDCRAASAQCCSALQSFLDGKCHCWQGFDQTVLARFELLQDSCAGSAHKVCTATGALLQRSRH